MLLEKTLSVLRIHWLKVGCWLLLILPLCSSLLAMLVLLTYVFWPQQYTAIEFDRFTPTQSRVSVLAHGLKDTPDTWITPLRSVLAVKQPEVELLTVDWSPYADNALRCAVNGSRIGQRIGEQMLSQKALESVQLIGHSCGAFVIYNICLALKENRPDIRVHTTYLDPVSIYGPLLHYGVHHFGDCADYSDAYIDTEDNVTGSNQLLPHTHTYDVTAVREQRNHKSPPHIWPAIYYRQLVEVGSAPNLDNTPNLNALKPRGILEKVSDFP